jgi:hypothetical protein
MTDVYVLAIDLAKRSFQVCATAPGGACVDAPSFAREFSNYFSLVGPERDRSGLMVRTLHREIVQVRAEYGFGNRRSVGRMFFCRLTNGFT